jgi:hypothetical protein
VLTAFLAGSGGKVVIPDAVAVEPGDSADEVRFVDAAGRTLAIFRRADVSIFAREGTLDGEAKVELRPEGGPEKA